MEPLHMNHIRDLIHQLRVGESERRIALDMHISRPTVHKYHELAKTQGYLEKDAALPDDATLQKVLGPGPQPPRHISRVESSAEVVQTLLRQDVEMVAIWQRLRDTYGYTGSYSAVRRYVARLEPERREAFTRVHNPAGDELQVDFGAVGQLFDPGGERLRTAYVFVATLGYSRHQYAELVFDQKVPTWIGLHRRALEYFRGCAAAGRAG